VVGTINLRPGAPDLGPYHTPAEWWDVAFWNKSVDRIYTYGSFNIAPLVIGPVGQLTLDFDSGNISATGPSPPQQLLLATDSTGFVPEHRGPAVQKGDLTLYRTPPPYRAQWATQWVDEDGWTLAGHTIRLRVYGGRGLPAGAAQVGIALRAAADGPHRYTLTYDGVTKKRVVRDRRLERLEICTPSSGHTDVQLRVPGGVHMGYRSVGVQLLRIQTQATGKPCRTS
jgi:hypothetical protein